MKHRSRLKLNNLNVIVQWGHLEEIREDHLVENLTALKGAWVEVGIKG